MSNQSGMLPGDEFSFDEWKAARGKERTTPVLMHPVVTAALYELEKACKSEGIPFVVALGLQNGEAVFHDLGSTPQNVSHPLLLARSAVVDAPMHKLALMGFSLQSLDLSKLHL